jgi:transposase
MAKRNGGGPRLLTAIRNQIEFRSFELDATLPEDHRARIIWTVVERLDLSAFYDEIQARGGRAGHPATDPKILLALWLYATTDGVGSGRELERLCGRDDAYRWLCGGVSVNYHTLNDFRGHHGDKLDQLMVQTLAAMTHQNLVTLEQVAQDGMRVRADAGAASFRRESTLLEHREAARAHVATLKASLTQDPGAKLRMQEQARQRAAQDRLARLERALVEMPLVNEVKRRNRGRKSKNGKPTGVARVSTTDPESRVMKMADGGFRPAYNVQLATDVESRVIVGVIVSNRGTDVPLMMPMLDDIARRTALQPGDHLVDGGYVNLDAITEAHERGVTVYAPVMTPAKTRVPGKRPRRPDTPATAQWRRRMERTDSKLIYKRRAATAETINADLRRWRTLDRFAVRGLAKARCQVLLNVLAHNFERWHDLAAA